MSKTALCGTLLLLLAATPALGGLISSNTYPYTNLYPLPGGIPTGGLTEALLTVNVYDNFNGDTSKWLWTYDVQNLSYDPIGPNGTSLGGLKLFSPGEKLIYVPFSIFGSNGFLVNDITPGYIQGCCSEFSGYWALGWINSAGLLAGQARLLQFTTPPSTIVTTTGTFGTIYNYSPLIALSGKSDVPGAPTPEPGTVMLVGAGVGLMLWARQKACPRPA